MPSSSDAPAPTPRSTAVRAPLGRDFRWFFASRALADTGTEMGAIAVPLMAIVLLGASPGEVGVIGALSTAAFLAIGLPTGVWVDRARRRPILFAGTLCHGLVLLSIPLASYADVLTLWQVYACVLVGGATTVFTRVAQQSHLPSLVPDDGLLRANSAITGASSTASVAGRGAGGYLVQFAGAPAVVLFNALTMIGSALAVLQIRRREPEPLPRSGTRLVVDIREGVRFVAGHRLLRPIAVASVTANLGINALMVMVPVAVLADGGTEGRVGLFFMVGGIGILLGSLAAGPIATRLGQGRCLWPTGLCAGVGALAVPFIGEGVSFWVATGGWALNQFAIGVHNVVQVSLRQEVTPGALLGRMTATMRFLLTGALTLSAAWAGATAELWGVSAALWIGAGVCGLSWVPLLLSPLRSVRDIPREYRGA